TAPAWVSAASAPDQATGDSTATPVSIQTLADLLENETTREQLINELRGLAQNVDASPTADAPPGTAEASEQAAALDSLPARIADLTQNFVQSVADDVVTAVAMFRSVGEGDARPSVSTDVWLASLS